MLDVGLSSTRKLAAFWGIMAERLATRCVDTATPIDTQKETLPAKPWAQRLHGHRIAPECPSVSGVGKVIEDALRAAGLML